MDHRVSRRDVFRSMTTSALAMASARAAETIQTRALGKTGVRVPIIAMGCGESWWKALNDEKKCFEAADLAIKLGITYFDTGQTYGRGTSESWLGKALKSRRDGVFVTTKISTRNGDDALRETERSLERLQTTWIDVVHIHNLGDSEDLKNIESKGGLLDAVNKLRDRKIARFIGITSHAHPLTLRTAIERHDFDCVQMALNAAQQGHYETSAHPGNSFETIVLPVAQTKNMGIIAMKVTGRNTLVGGLPDKAVGGELIRYALSLPIAVAVVGMADHAHIHENATIARSFQPMPNAEMKILADRMAKMHKAALDRHFLNHIDS